MTSQRLLWMLVFTFSIPVEAQPDVTKIPPKAGPHHHATVPNAVVRVVTLDNPLMLHTEDEEQRGLTIDEHNYGMCAIKQILTSPTEASVEAETTRLAGMDMKQESLKTEAVYYNSNASTKMPLMRQIIGGMKSQHLKESRQTLAGERKQVVHQDTTEVAPVKTREDGVRTAWFLGSLQHQPLLRATAADSNLIDLMSYLISLTSGRQFYLVYDDITSGVVRSFQESLGDTTLLPYDPNILLLSEVLTSNHQAQAMRNVFILCSAKHLANLFEQVRNKLLESPTIQWFVIVDKDVTEELQLLLREGTQVALVQRLTPEKAQLFSSRIDPDGQIRFHQVGWWSANGGWPSGLSSHQLVPDLQRLYADFRGRQLVFTTVDNWPFIKIKTLENGTIIPISGFDLSVLNTLSDTLNFTYRMTGPPDGKWGGPQPDKTVTGMVGQVARREVHAIICELTITSSRETVVDFTMPYFMESTTLVSPAPKERNRSFAILSPFTVGVWFSLCLATVLVGPLLYLVTRLLVLYLGEKDEARYSLQSCSFNMYRNLMVQGNLIHSKRWPLRLIFFSWYLFSLYINALYSGTLTAVLAITSYEEPIDSLHELAQALRDGYTIGVVRDSSYEDAFKSAKSGIYQEVWQLFSHEDRNQSFLPNPDAGIDRILEQKYVLIHALLNSKVKATQRGRDKFHFGRQTFLHQGYGIACNTGSPLKDTFNSILLQLNEAGLVGKWASDEVNKVSLGVTSSSGSGPAAISLQHLQAAFYIVVLGFAISTTALGVEVIANTWLVATGQHTLKT